MAFLARNSPCSILINKNTNRHIQQAHSLRPYAQLGRRHLPPRRVRRPHLRKSRPDRVHDRFNLPFHLRSRPPHHPHRRRLNRHHWRDSEVHHFSLPSPDPQRHWKQNLRQTSGRYRSTESTHCSQRCRQCPLRSNPHLHRQSPEPYAAFDLTLFSLHHAGYKAHSLSRLGEKKSWTSQIQHSTQHRKREERLSLSRELFSLPTWSLSLSLSLSRMSWFGDKDINKEPISLSMPRDS
ncbi:hypothetical protein CsSME_00032460 [Camellia sinensis var. sinensis]